MLQLILSSAVLSLLHSLLPNHWLAVLAVGKREGWSTRKTTQITFVAGLAHALSTVLIGVLISLIGITLNARFETVTHWGAPAILVLMGLFFIWQHHRHHHFHLHGFKEHKDVSDSRLILLLVLAMFLSPCLEFSAVYVLAWDGGWVAVLIISLIYVSVSVAGMVLWVYWAARGLHKANWHALEHNAGMISGAVLIATGVLFFFLH